MYLQFPRAFTPVNNCGARFFQKKRGFYLPCFFFHIARLYMHGARYESARRFYHISHAMRNESVRFESTRVYMPDARPEKKKPTTTATTGVRTVRLCHAPVIDKAGDLLGKFTRQMQNGVCLVFALPAPKAKRRTLRGGKAREFQAEVARQKGYLRQLFLLQVKNCSCMWLRFLSYL